MKTPRTLAARIGLTTSLALLAFILFTGLLVFRYILLPVGHQAADDLAALIVLSARTWAELPPGTRPDFEEELARNHELTLRTDPPGRLEPLHRHSPYLRFLEESLGRRLGTPTHLQQAVEEPGPYWAVVPVAGRTLYFGFSHERMGARPPMALLGILAGAGLFTLVTTLLLVHLVSRPLTRLGEGVERLGRQGFAEPLPEDGPRELALLARRFNELSGEVQRLLENRTTLLGGISHDLRTPLARLGIALELLHGRADPELLRRMGQDLEEMNGLITRTLELAGAMQADEGTLERRPLEALAAELVEEYAREGRPVRLRCARPCPLEVPALPVRRILGNLLDNALHHGGNGEVTLSLECGKGAARACVADRGPGIPEKELEQVFQPFHRLDPSRSSTTGGSGLGLAIVRQLADLHGWQVTLENRREGGLQACLVLEGEAASTQG